MCLLQISILAQCLTSCSLSAYVSGLQELPNQGLKNEMTSLFSLAALGVRTHFLPLLEYEIAKSGEIYWDDMVLSVSPDVTELGPVLVIQEKYFTVYSGFCGFPCPEMQHFRSIVQVI